MRLFIAILFLLSASASYAAGITSKTADFVIYKNSLGSSTIPIPNWELVIDGDSLAGQKNLPVPRSDRAFNVKLPLPRAKLMTNLAKFAKLNPYLFIAQALIDLYYDEAKQQFMTRRNPHSASNPCAGNKIASLLQQCVPDAIVEEVSYRHPNLGSLVYFLSPATHVGKEVVIFEPRPGERYLRIGNSDSCVFPYSGVLSPSDACSSPDHSLLHPSTELVPSTETDIVQNLNKNLTADKLSAVRDLVKSQNWTLETEATPTVSGPPEVVISTSTRTRQNPDGTTTTEKVVEKNVYTYNNNVINVITENHVTQVFHGDQLVENNVTEVNNETNSERVDYTFQPPTGEYPTDMKVPEKRDLVAEVLNPVASQLQGFRSKIGLRGSGQCSFDVPFSLGPASGSGRLDFCQYQSTFSTLGSMLVAFAYLMAGLIVLGMRH